MSVRFQCWFCVRASWRFPAQLRAGKPERKCKAMKLHGYFRSGASWRVRIALNLKGLAGTQVFHHLRRGEQRAPDYLALNPQGLVPALELDDGTVLTQSIAIIEWLDETYPEPALLPSEPLQRAHVRAFALVLAADTHPVQNLKVLNALRPGPAGRGRHKVGCGDQCSGTGGLRGSPGQLPRAVLLWSHANARRYLPCTSTRLSAAVWRGRRPFPSPP